MTRDPSAMTPSTAAWIQELDLSVPITAQYLLTGNVHDVHLRPDGSFGTTVAMVRACLVANDYDLVYRFNSLDGIWLEHVRDGVTSNDFFPDSHLNRATVGALAKLADLLVHTGMRAELRVALIIDSGSTIWADHDNVEGGRLLLASRRLATSDVRRVPGGNRIVPPANTIIWIADAENDAPAWLRHSDSTRTLRIPLPSLSMRRAAAAGLLTEIDGEASDPPARESQIAAFAETTQGVTLRAMRSIALLAQDQQSGPDRIDEAVRSYLAGVVDSPWQDPHLLERIKDAEAIVERRVLGQAHAVRRALDILRRSALGLTGAHHGRSGTRPQGILFFAGPTGVGKTELAKTLAEVLFGAEDAYIRFDMSEFSAEHSEARLIGAPPGYIGHREGGELTNAVRERPFSVILFDEIEKAHPRILDKFLQILDDGRLTDGSGDTVHFSESVIIFTSNLGASAALRDAVREHPDSESAGPGAAAMILATIQHHFTDVLHRPELLSRMGDNIIVFDAISPEIGVTLVTKYIGAVVDTVQARLGAPLVLADQVRAAVEDYALTKLPFGGRGIGTAVETALVNPLARSLASAERGKVVRVSAATHTDHGWELTVEVSQKANPHP